MIKNIILDMGNVLLDYNPQIPLDAFCHSREEKQVIQKELFEGPEWAMGDRGEIRDEDRYARIKERVPRKYRSALKRCCDDWDICMKPLEGAADFCRYVKNRGYSIYILSNASDKFYRYFPQFLPLDYFDGVVVSADVGSTKPEREIYEFLLNRYQLAASECLFIDDRADNVEGARQAGMQACRFDGDFEKIKQEELICRPTI